MTCSVLNLTTCQFLAPVTTSPVELDEFGCYDKNDYFSDGDKYRHYQQFSGCMTILVMIVGGAGLIGNVIAVICLSSPEMNNCFNQIVIAMNIMDSGHILFALMDCTRLN